MIAQGKRRFKIVNKYNAEVCTTIRNGQSIKIKLMLGIKRMLIAIISIPVFKIANWPPFI